MGIGTQSRKDNYELDRSEIFEALPQPQPATALGGGFSFGLAGTNHCETNQGGTPAAGCATMNTAASNPNSDVMPVSGGDYPFVGKPFSKAAAQWLMEKHLRLPGVMWIKLDSLGIKAREDHIVRGGMSEYSKSALQSAAAALRLEGAVEVQSGFYRWKPLPGTSESYPFQGLPFSQGIAQKLILEHLDGKDTSWVSSNKLCDLISRRHLAQGGISGGDETFAVRVVYAAGRKLKEDGKVVHRAGHYRRNVPEGHSGYPYDGLPYSSEALQWLIEEYLRDRPDEWVPRRVLITRIAERHVLGGGRVGGLDPYYGSSHVLLRLKRQGTIVSERGSHKWPSRRANVGLLPEREYPELPDNSPETSAFAAAAERTVVQYLEGVFPQWKTSRVLMEHAGQLYLNGGGTPVPDARKRKIMEFVLGCLEKKGAAESRRLGRGEWQWRHVPHRVDSKLGGNVADAEKSACGGSVASINRPAAEQAPPGFAGGAVTSIGRLRPGSPGKISINTLAKLNNAGTRRVSIRENIEQQRRRLAEQKRMANIKPEVSAGGRDEKLASLPVDCSPAAGLGGKEYPEESNPGVSYERAAEGWVGRYLEEVFPQWKTRQELQDHVDQLYLNGGGTPVPDVERQLALAAVLRRWEKEGNVVLLRLAKGVRQWRHVPVPISSAAPEVDSETPPVAGAEVSDRRPEDYVGYGLPATGNMLLPLVEERLRAKSPGWLRRRDIVADVMEEHLRLGGLPPLIKAGPDQTIKSALGKLKKAGKIEHKYPWVRWIGSREETFSVPEERSGEETIEIASTQETSVPVAEYAGKGLPPLPDLVLPLVEERLRAKAPGWLRRRDIVASVMEEHLRRGGLSAHLKSGPDQTIKSALIKLKKEGKIEHKYPWVRWRGTGSGAPEPVPAVVADEPVDNLVPAVRSAPAPSDFKGLGLPATPALLLPLVESHMQAKSPGWLRRRDIVSVVMEQYLRLGGLPPRTKRGADQTMKKTLAKLNAAGKIEHRYPWVRWRPGVGADGTAKPEIVAPRSPENETERINTFPKTEVPDYAGRGLPPTADLILPLIENFMKSKLNSSLMGWTSRPEIVEAVYKDHLALGGAVARNDHPIHAVKTALRKLREKGRIVHQYSGAGSKVRWLLENGGSKMYPRPSTEAAFVNVRERVQDADNGAKSEVSGSTQPDPESSAPLEFGDPEASGTIYAFYNPAEREVYRQQHPGTNNYPLKIGKTDTPDWEKRLERQSQTLWAKPQVVLVYRTNEPTEWESLLHRALKMQKKHIPPQGGGGTEWFLTNPEYVKHIIDRNQPESQTTP